MRKHSTLAKHKLVDTDSGCERTLARFWSIPSISRNAELFPLTKPGWRTVVIDDKRVPYTVMDSQSPWKPGYKLDPYKNHPDRVFLGFGDPATITVR